MSPPQYAFLYSPVCTISRYRHYNIWLRASLRIWGFFFSVRHSSPGADKTWEVFKLAGLTTSMEVVCIHSLISNWLLYARWYHVLSICCICNISCTSRILSQHTQIFTFPQPLLQRHWWASTDYVVAVHPILIYFLCFQSHTQTTCWSTSILVFNKKCLTYCCWLTHKRFFLNKFWQICYFVSLLLHIAFLHSIFTVLIIMEFCHGVSCLLTVVLVLMTQPPQTDH